MKQPLAYIHPDAKIAPTVVIEPFVTIDKNVVIGEGTRIGYVTTGYQSISTGKSVCMALIDSRYAALGTEVDVRIRKKLFKGTVCKKRFYQKNYKK